MTDQILEKATFGAGCFWGIEETFRRVKGIEATAVGYMGGSLDNPTYKDVCSDKAGYAEVVQLEYDPNVVKYEDLLKIFWSIHDPTTLNRQGPDIGSQYRSVIFFHTGEQEKLAEKSKADLEKSKKFGRPIVTQISPASTFWRAEEYHQRYIEKGGAAACHI